MGLDVTFSFHPARIRTVLLCINRVEAMGCVAEPVWLSEAGHCLFSLAANEAGGLTVVGEMRHLADVVPYPSGDLNLRIRQAHEQGLVEKLVMDATIEALDKAVLH